MCRQNEYRYRQVVTIYLFRKFLWGVQVAKWGGSFRSSISYKILACQNFGTVKVYGIFQEGTSRVNFPVSRIFALEMYSYKWRDTLKIVSLVWIIVFVLEHCHSWRKHVVTELMGGHWGETKTGYDDMIYCIYEYSCIQKKNYRGSSSGVHRVEEESAQNLFEEGGMVLRTKDGFSAIVRYGWRSFHVNGMEILIRDGRKTPEVSVQITQLVATRVDIPYKLCNLPVKQ